MKVRCSGGGTSDESEMLGGGTSDAQPSCLCLCMNHKLMQSGSYSLAEVDTIGKQQLKRTQSGSIQIWPCKTSVCQSIRLETTMESLSCGEGGMISKAHYVCREERTVVHHTV